jgi:hypothetical protein
MEFGATILSELHEFLSANDFYAAASLSSTGRPPQMRVPRTSIAP